MKNIKHYTIQVTGKVQGVFFRASIKKLALDLGITGWIRNESDGSVRIEAEGAIEQLREFVEYCKVGPERAQVSQINYQEVPLNDFMSFEII